LRMGRCSVEAINTMDAGTGFQSNAKPATLYHNESTPPCGCAETRVRLWYFVRESVRMSRCLPSLSGARDS
jgi:hypothetical protein